MTIPSRFNHTTKRLCAALLVTGMALAGSGCAKLQNWRDHDKGIKIENLKVPTGYRVALLAEGAAHGGRHGRYLICRQHGGQCLRTDHERRRSDATARLAQRVDKSERRGVATVRCS